MVIVKLKDAFFDDEGTLSGFLYGLHGSNDDLRCVVLFPWGYSVPRSMH